MKIGNLAARALVALFAVPILIYAIYQPRHEVVWGILFIASGLAMREFFGMTIDDATDRAVSLVIGLAACAAFYWLPNDYQPAVVAIVIACVVPMLYYVFRFGDMDSAARRLAFSITGIVYGGLILTFLAFIKRDFGPLGPGLMVFVLATAWLSDTGGYFAGKFLGKRKLYPAVSPNKTWAGSIGGVAAAAAGAVGLKLVPQLEMTLMPWFDILFIAIAGSIIGQVGDLCESLLKRSVGVKDSGQLLPGHGGLLDRVDAVLFIAPFVYVYMTVRIAMAAG